MSETGPDWDRVAAFLAGPGLADDGPAEVIETHTARVHLAGARVWKLRRPVDYGWLDYASRARRRIMAEREIAWNEATAPGLYLGLGGVSEGPEGLRLIRPGSPVPAAAEPLVAMRRFPAEALFDRMADEGRLSRALMAGTGAAVAAMHKAAEPGAPVDLPALVGAETAALAALSGTLGEALTARLTGAMAAAAQRLAETAAGRRCRRCHGDLHLRNIVLWQGRPAPFDCIEFNDALSRIDPLYDLAFLTMDLHRRGLSRLVPAALNAWAEALAAAPGPEPETAYGGLALLPLYEATRAAIRAKTGALGGDAAEARAYAGLALARLGPAPAPRLVAVGGPSGSGKSTLARALADRMGAVVLRSDAIRKGLRGVAETEALPPEAYAPAASAEVYAAMLARARMALGGAMPVVLDATHLDPGERARAAALAAAAGAGFQGLWLAAPGETLAGRIRGRGPDASDATPAVLERQLAGLDAPADWTMIPAGQGPERVAGAAAAALGL
ncbi:bifunctional aminoglycoside phosphotransferase/ATP-binding protein [Paralimibaculum aggregatum]|uniref:Bifunctional aminoglycoside phosphotransferase/ATP-binding protein n=1 Tax=Paralimibaculum aggregatum TaxID=3036245 RepID=A0ABQ6LHF0_9RHOB|nr:AAA family ATPase [Limibaculum sp. NKW23]GMG82711.1 bifunctional aminoglycoside phosphotransferase/ATP-binding protein [Limibaculum sp. NKW23]